MYFQPLLYTCILSTFFPTDGIPIHSNSLKNLVRTQADTIIQIINLHYKKLNLSSNLLIGDPELYLEVPADKPIQGLGSIVDTLTTFQKVLQGLPNGHVTQLHNYVFNLLDYLNKTMTIMHCTPKESANRKSLDTSLEVYVIHHVTFGHMALGRLKEFMQKLIVNLDQLKSC